MPPWIPRKRKLFKIDNNPRTADFKVFMKQLRHNMNVPDSDFLEPYISEKERVLLDEIVDKITRNEFKSGETLDDLNLCFFCQRRTEIAQIAQVSICGHKECSERMVKIMYRFDAMLLSDIFEVETMERITDKLCSMYGDEVTWANYPLHCSMEITSSNDYELFIICDTSDDIFPISLSIFQDPEIEYRFRTDSSHFLWRKCVIVLIILWKTIIGGDKKNAEMDEMLERLKKAGVKTKDSDE